MAAQQSQWRPMPKLLHYPGKTLRHPPPGPLIAQYPERA
jgi:hypothetical protein